MIKLLIWFLLAWLVVTGLRKIARSEPASRPGAGNLQEEMVRCVRCGLHVPKSEAFPVDGGWACSPGHAATGHGASTDRT